MFVVVNGTQAAAEALKIAERLRSELPHRRFEANLGGGKFKAQFQRADRSGAPLAVIIGDDELSRGVVAVKPLRQESGQSDCPIPELAARIEAALGGVGTLTHRIEERFVDEFLPEAEQWERAKAWLRTYGVWIVGGVLLALAGIAAWNWYQNRQDDVAAQASSKYHAAHAGARRQ